LKRAGFSPGIPCIEAALSTTIRKFGLRSWYFTISIGLTRAYTCPGSDQDPTSRMLAAHQRRKAREELGLIEVLADARVDQGRDKALPSSAVR
jgi:hypothetical protein